MPSTSSNLFSSSFCFSLILSFFASRESAFLSRYSSLWFRRFSCLCTSFLRSRISRSASERSLCTSSLASNTFSFLEASASAKALLMILVASWVAEPISFSAVLRRCATPKTKPKTAKTMAQTAPTITGITTLLIINSTSFCINFSFLRWNSRIEYHQKRYSLITF